MTPHNALQILQKAFSTLPDPPPLDGRPPAGPAAPLGLRHLSGGHPISGGSINTAYQLLTKDNSRWFCKFNDNVDFPDLFVREAKDWPYYRRNRSSAPHSPLPAPPWMSGNCSSWNGSISPRQPGTFGPFSASRPPGNTGLRQNFALAAGKSSLELRPQHR